MKIEIVYEKKDTGKVAAFKTFVGKDAVVEAATYKFSHPELKEASRRTSKSQ